MTSSRPNNGPRHVPPPPGGGKPAASYARFIPREELADFAAWTPDAFGDDLAQATGAGRPASKNTGKPSSEAPAAAPPEPTAEQWLARAEEARQQGYAQGYRDGLEALEAAKRQFAQQISGQMAQIVAAFDEQTQGLESHWADALVQTAVMLARQVVRSEIALRQDCITQVAHDAVSALILSARHLRLRLNPADLPLVEAGCADLLRARTVLLQGDATIEPGGCVLESDLGQVDARIETRWAHAAAVLGSGQDWAPVADVEEPAE